jgi:hypothetical protein
MIVGGWTSLKKTRKLAPQSELFRSLRVSQTLISPRVYFPVSILYQAFLVSSANPVSLATYTGGSPHPIESSCTTYYSVKQRVQIEPHMISEIFSLFACTATVRRDIRQRFSANIFVRCGLIIQPQTYGACML